MNTGLLIFLLVLESSFRPTPFWTGSTDVVSQTYAPSYILPLTIWLFLRNHSGGNRIKTTTLLPTTLPTTRVSTLPELTTTTPPNCLTCDVIISADCEFFGCDPGAGSMCTSSGNPAPLTCGQLVTQLICESFGCTFNDDDDTPCGPNDREIFCSDIGPADCQFSTDDSCCVLDTASNTCVQA